MIRPRWPRQAILSQWRPLRHQQSHLRQQIRLSSDDNRKPRTQKTTTPTQSRRSHKPDSSSKVQWPKLERRKPSFPWDHVSPEDAESEAALAEKLKHTGSTKEEFTSRLRRTAGETTPPLLTRRRKPGGSVADHVRRAAQIDWSALASSAELMRESKKNGDATQKLEEKAASTGHDPKRMLFIRGLSDNLTAADFFRLAPTDLSSFGQSIQKVQQQRDPKTFKLLGCEQISFTSAEAASAYLDNFRRVQRLARHRLTSRTGLWHATAPEYLLRSNDIATANADIEALTVASPSHPDIWAQRKRVSLKYPWAKELSAMVKPFGFGDYPSVVLVDVSPEGLHAPDLEHFIKQDGWRRDLGWDISPPIPVVAKQQQEQGNQKPHRSGDDEAKENPKDARSSRFVIACASVAEAWRFHRHWNHQTVNLSVDDVLQSRRMLRTSVVQW